MNRKLFLILPILLFLFFLLILALSPPPSLRELTGEEAFAPQVRGVWHLISGRLRPYPQMEPLMPVRHAGLYPFGINTFLQNETEPDKVELSLDMIAEGGFRWIRQEFTWEDVEIHRDDWFVDLRNNEIRNSWAKYDRIVELAEARGIEIIVRLSNPPIWSRALGNELGAKAPPDFLSDYGDYVEAVVSRYAGRIRYYQVWNEPNCCEEWGRQSVSPEQYTEMLKMAHTRAKAADPQAVILTAPLAPTIEMLEEKGVIRLPAFNDFLFLQRMYDAGAKAYFDVLAVQDYGLWSGPLDRRMRPRVINFSRPEYIRDIMIRNGDGNKAIWASEIGWNSPPEGVPPNFGNTPEALRGSYLIEALERQQQEWPWMGVTTVWFFKQASDDEAEQSQYYFKLVNPDFTPLPVWDEFTEYIGKLEPTLYRGYHQEDHWVLREELSQSERWSLQQDENAVLEQFALGKEADNLRFSVQGKSLTLVLLPNYIGLLRVKIGSEQQRFRFDGNGPPFLLSEQGEINDLLGTEAIDSGKSVLHLPFEGLPAEAIRVELLVEEGQIGLDGLIVE